MAIFRFPVLLNRYHNTLSVSTVTPKLLMTSFMKYYLSSITMNTLHGVRRCSFVITQCWVWKLRENVSIRKWNIHLPLN